MPLHCRYCGCLYEDGARACDRCGAPKTRPARLLDAQAEPDHWSRSLSRALSRLTLVTMAIMAVNMPFRGGEPPVPLLLLNLGWILGVLPLLLVYASWQSARPKIVRLLFHLAGAAGFWFVATGLIIWAQDPGVFTD